MHAQPTRRKVLALSALLLVAAVPAFAQKPAQKNQVVMQVSDNDPAKWNLALNNANNLQKDLGMDEVELEIVAYGPGIAMLKSDSAVAARITGALGNGIKVVACENTMAGQKLQKPDMLPNLGYVPAGVVELMKKQQQGWAYIRP
jgi:intracellular sulfur oxidation DsrE/DsrF family protein